VTTRRRRVRGTVVMTLAAGEGAFVAVSPTGYRVDAPLTLLTVTALRDPGLMLIGAASGALTFDLSEVPEVDSAGLALLIDWLASARSRSLTLRYAKPGRTLLALARLSEVEPLLTEGEPPPDETKPPAEPVNVEGQA
jgi:phospholipid transport system transporter-binding protein